MVVLLWLPIVTLVIIHKMSLQLVALTIHHLSRAILADGELSAITWLAPAMVLAWCWCNEPRSLPPEQEEYVPKRKRRTTIGAKLLAHCPRSWKSAWSRMATMAGSHQRQGGVLIGRRCHHRYDAYSPSKARSTAKKINRSLARRMRLVTLTCMVSAALAEPVVFDSDAKPIAIDNCSSRCLTTSRKDFLPGTVEPCNVVIVGVGGRVKCDVKGTVCWTIEDDQGRSHDIIVPDTPMCPTLPHRLLSPQHWAQETERRDKNAAYKKAIRPSCSTNADETVLRWGNGKFAKTVPLDRKRNVAVMMTKSGIKRYSVFATSVRSMEQDISCFVATGVPECDPAVVTDDEGSTSGTDDGESTTSTGLQEEDRPMVAADFEDQPRVRNVSVEREIPLERDKDELYRMHVRMGHLSFAKIRAMAGRGEVPRRLARCPSPMCAACKYGKATRKAWRTKAKSRHTVKTVNAPGECVSVDQLESRVVGFVAQLKGKLTKGRYRIATVFVDHYSRLGYVHLQKDSTSAETLKAKKAFELFASKRGVKVRHYHADNGRFVDNAWKEGLEQENQGITYCGVNAHWQNGIAERRIRDLKEQARTMVLHAQHHWPEGTSVNLWPYALRTACTVFNDAPALKGVRKNRTPFEQFTGSRISAEPRHHHTFGCPVYVLANALQQGKPLKAWMERARVGVNLGISPTHARSVALVLSLKTGLASPQFHVKHDDLFETVSERAGRFRMPRSHWMELAGLSPSTAVAPREVPMNTSRSGQERSTSSQSVSGSANDEEGIDVFDGSVDENGSMGEPEESIGGNVGANDAAANGSESGTRDAVSDTIEVPRQPHPLEGINDGRTRSGRKIRPTQRARESQFQRGKKWVSWLANVSQAQNELAKEDAGIYEVFAHREYDVQDRASDPIAFSATSDPDTMYWHQAMQEPDRADFLRAAEAEVKSHVDNQHFILMKRADIPKNTKILASVWSMKRKRRILSREVYKWKARLNAHGGQQEHGVNFWETYSPVVNWFSIRLFLIISILNDWETRQIDFVLAFPQADVECDIYMEVPPGFDVKGEKKMYCLKLRKNIYGTKQAGRVWNAHLHKGLSKLGYKQSTIDTCVYYHGQAVFMLYVDDGIFTGPDEQEIKELIEGLRAEFNITDEGDLKEYLGVLVEKQGDGRTKLSQPHLIKQILDDLWFNERTKSKPTPAPGGQVPTRSGCRPNGR